MIDMNDLRIIFMGTPEFAVATLDKLLNAGCNIVGVITAPDKPAGRGMQLTESVVKKYAVSKNLNILQPEKLKAPEFLDELRSLKATLQIVVAFRMLPEIVWNMPIMGTINLHGSLLPQYRGAAPINWAIINGEKETGVTTFKLQHEIDTGDILLQVKLKIGDHETAGELHDRMKESGADIILRTVKKLADGNTMASPQVRSYRDGEMVLKPAPKIFTETCRIDWKNNVEDIYNLIRGLSPHPGAFTFLNGKKIKIFKSEKEIIVPGKLPGEFITDNKTFLKFASCNGYISIKELQLEGKKKMNVEEFLRGFKEPPHLSSPETI